MDSGNLQAAETNATERVAFDLMEKIAEKEALPERSPRRYYLELYSQCLYVVKTGGMPQGMREHPVPPKKTRRRAAPTPRPKGKGKAVSASMLSDARETDLPTLNGQPAVGSPSMPPLRRSWSRRAD